MSEAKSPKPPPRASALTSGTWRNRKPSESGELPRAAVSEDFIADLAHELRCPINAIVGWTDLLLADEETLDARVARALRVIRRNAALQSRLVEDLVDLSRLAHGKYRLQMQRLRPAQVTRAAIDAVSVVAHSKNVEIVLRDRSEGETVVADDMRLQQAITNLLSNAVKFTPACSTVNVRIGSGEGSIHIEVEDMGPGVKATNAAYIFDRYQQERRDGSSARDADLGLGLGLSIARDIVELHDGRVSVRAGATGAVFTISLPIARGPVRA